MNERDMRRYSYLHELKKKDSNFVNNNDLLTMIEQSYSKMDKYEKRYILNKIITDQFIDDTILKFVYFNSLPKKKEMTPNQLAKYAQNMFFRFQGRAGGVYIDDTVWVCDDEIDYEEKKKYVVMKNTVDNLDAKDNDTGNFIKRAVERLNAASYNIVSYRVKEDDEDKITRIKIYIGHM